MAIWMGISPGSERSRVLVQDGPGKTLLKARLPAVPAHPRALATLCEALALWCGQPVRAVLAAGGPGGSFDTTRWLGGDGPTATALFEMAVVSVARPPRGRDRLDGFGDFRDLRQLVFFEVAE
jgi:hypothetical protein